LLLKSCCKPARIHATWESALLLQLTWKASRECPRCSSLRRIAAVAAWYNAAGDPSLPTYAGKSTLAVRCLCRKTCSPERKSGSPCLICCWTPTPAWYQWLPGTSHWWHLVPWHSWLYFYGLVVNILHSPMREDFIHCILLCKRNEAKSAWTLVVVVVHNNSILHLPELLKVLPQSILVH
jgi:hypothetical protein